MSDTEHRTCQCDNPWTPWVHVPADGSKCYPLTPVKNGVFGATSHDVWACSAGLTTTVTDPYECWAYRCPGPHHRLLTGPELQVFWEPGITP